MKAGLEADRRKWEVDLWWQRNKRQARGGESKESGGAVKVKLKRKSDGEWDWGEGEAWEKVAARGTPAYYPWVKPGVSASCEPDSSGRLPLPGTALSLLLPACPRGHVGWRQSRSLSQTSSVVKANPGSLSVSLKAKCSKWTGTLFQWHHCSQKHEVRSDYTCCTAWGVDVEKLLWFCVKFIYVPCFM